MKFLGKLALGALLLFLGCGKTGEYGPPLAPNPDAVDRTTLVAFIKKTNPQIRDKDAFHIAETLAGKSVEYGLDLKRFASVIAQESHFRLNLKSCYEVVLKDGSDFRTQCDLGLGQISPLWVRELKLDANRLQYDVHYNLDVAAQILKHYKSKYPKDPLSFSRYYNGKKELRRGYEKLVNKHHTRLANLINPPSMQGVMLASL